MSLLVGIGNLTDTCLAGRIIKYPGEGKEDQPSLVSKKERKKINLLIKPKRLKLNVPSRSQSVC